MTKYLALGLALLATSAAKADYSCNGVGPSGQSVHVTTDSTPREGGQMTWGGPVEESAPHGLMILTIDGNSQFLSMTKPSEILSDGIRYTAQKQSVLIYRGANSELSLAGSKISVRCKFSGE